MRIEIIDPDRCVGCEICMLACVRRQGFGGLAKSKIAVHSSGGMVERESPRVTRWRSMP